MKKALGSIFLIILCLIGTRALASSLTSTQNLSFGTLIPTATSGSVIISMSGAINQGGSVTLAPSGTSYYQGLMTFTATGLSAVLEIVTITVLDSSVTLTNSRAGGGTVTVSNFTTNNSLNVTLLNPTINNIPLGGTMTFNSSSKGGSYTGSVRVRTNGLLSGTTNATVPIILTLWNSLSMSETAQLNFGGIEVLSGNSTVRVNPQTNARSVVSGNSGVNLIGGAANGVAGQFSVSGEPSKSVSISLPSSITLAGNRGGTMTVNNFVGSPSSTATTLDSSGNLTLKIGADLLVGAGQTSGTYTGTYSVTVNY